jgi:hypothetical protein
MGRQAGNEDLLEYIERQPADRRNKRFMGIHIGTQFVALPHQFVDGLLQNRNFIIKLYQSKGRLNEESFDP